nr:UPF0481 protein At3g47200-like [Populus alba]
MSELSCFCSEESLHRINVSGTPRVPKICVSSTEFQNDYTPQVISIGPFHHGKKELQEMEEQKTLYLREFLGLCKVSVKDFIAAIAERESRLRNCYAETTDNLSRE